MTDTAVGRTLDLIERLARLIRSARRRHADLDPVHWETLRYFARANRYSRNPTALTRYLAATKGTISQTIAALERRALLAREPDDRDRRSIRLALTPAGRRLIARDPLVGSLDRLAGADLEQLQDGLTDLLATVQRANDHRPFGMCQRCRHFRRDDASGERGGPHRCGLTREPLSDLDSTLICAEHEPRDETPRPRPGA
ncbi:MAG: winged helix DNA-binding protein [Alphaproteobacteria bacterium]|nr:winged helix DNA-binding protein [Alphaproteobacteria bacterium]